jgi:hypothetical protein
MGSFKPDSLPLSSSLALLQTVGDTPYEAFAKLVHSSNIDNICGHIKAILMSARRGIHKMTIAFWACGSCQTWYDLG